MAAGVILALVVATSSPAVPRWATLAACRSGAEQIHADAVEWRRRAQVELAAKRACEDRLAARLTPPPPAVLHEPPPPARWAAGPILVAAGAGLLVGVILGIVGG